MSALHGREWPASRPGRVIPGEEGHGTHRIDDQVGPQPVWTFWRIEKTFVNGGIEPRFLGRPARGISSPTVPTVGREAQSASRLTTGWTVRGSNPGGSRFSAVQTGPGAHPVSCTMGTGSFLGVKYGRGLLLTTQPLLVPRSWKSRAIPLPTLFTTIGPVTGTLYLYYTH